MAIPGGMMDRAIQARKQQPGYNPNILGPFGNLITGVGNLLQGKPYATSFTGVGNIPPSARGESYRRAELRLADAARPGGGGGGGGNVGYSIPSQQGMSTPAAPGPGTTTTAVLDPYAAQNRAYQQERARVEAMVKANPDMQKQEIADARAKVRDQGMAIWAAANPTLAKNLQPGQVGYDAVQQALVGNEAGQAMRQGYGFQTPQQMLMTPPPGVNAPQGLPAVSSFGASSTYGQQGLQIDPEMEKKFQALLNQTQK